MFTIFALRASYPAESTFTSPSRTFCASLRTFSLWSHSDFLSGTKFVLGLLWNSLKL